MEDVQYLMQNSVEEQYLFMVDSNLRDKAAYPHPNHYQVTFQSSFNNVVGLDVVDASIPRTQYSVDEVFNGLVVDIGDGPVPVRFEVGDHTDLSLVDALNAVLAANFSITAKHSSLPPKRQNLIVFTSSTPFSFHMQDSTIRDAIGFNEPAAGNRYLGKRFLCLDSINAPDVYTSVAANAIDVSVYNATTAPEATIDLGMTTTQTVRRVAQKFISTATGFMHEVRVACGVQGIGSSSLIDWEQRESSISNT
jgi:hypothetical protein